MADNDIISDYEAEGLDTVISQKQEEKEDSKLEWPKMTLSHDGTKDKCMPREVYSRIQHAQAL